MEAGADDFLAKPFDRADLEQAIHRLALPVSSEHVQRERAVQILECTHAEQKM